MTTVPLDPALYPGARPAEAGEQCDCGRPAVLVYEPDGAIATAWCGVSE